MFGGIFRRGAVPNLLMCVVLLKLRRAIAGYDYGTLDFSVYDELTEFVAERDPKTIAVNYSDWLAVADGISLYAICKTGKNIRA